MVEAGSPHRGALVKQEVNRFCNNPLKISFESVRFDLTKCDPWSVMNPRFLENLSLPTHNLSTPSQGNPILSIGESILDSKPSLSGKPVSPRPWHHLQKWKPRGNSNRPAVSLWSPVRSFWWTRGGHYTFTHRGQLSTRRETNSMAHPQALPS